MIRGEGRGKKRGYGEGGSERKAGKGSTYARGGAHTYVG